MRGWLALGCLVIALLLPGRPAGAGDGAEDGDGVAAFGDGAYAAARRALAPLGQAGDRESQFYLGLMFRDGRGVRADADTAELWFRLAAEHGHLAAMVALGELDLTGTTSQAIADPPVAAVDAAVWLGLALPLLPAGADRERVAAALAALAARLSSAEAAEAGRQTAERRLAAPPAAGSAPLVALARPLACAAISCDCAAAPPAGGAQCRRAEAALVRQCRLAGGALSGACDPVAAGEDAVPAGR